MDTKSLAKSKRAHSLHLNKKHSHRQAVKVPSTSSGTGVGSKSISGKQTGVKPHPSHGSRTLPSNYDRYDEDLESEETVQESSSQPSEFVAPKSKGADYKYLISEATAQSQASYSSDGLLLFNDGLEDITWDFGPLLAAKGQSILSWIADDSFDFEDRPGASQEPSFLSLDLSDLAVQLAKAKPSERLFVESDLLPPELLDDELLSCSEEHDQVKTGTPAVTLDSGASSLDQEDREPMSRAIAISGKSPPNDDISASQETVGVSSNSFSTCNADSVSGSLPTTFEAVNADAELYTHSNSFNETSGSVASFDVANAEAELDMLLNSFNETELLQSSSSSTSRNLSTATATTESAKKREHPVVSNNIDDTIDNLLQETSDVTTSYLPSTSHPSSKSKIMDDFDSWLDSI